MNDPIKASLLSFITNHKSTLTSTTQTLVRAPSPNPTGDISAASHAALRLITELLPSASVSTHETAPGLLNVVAVLRNGPTPKKRLIFTGHLDTYPLGDPSSWTMPAGTLSHDGKRLYGRGSADMKGGIAASLVAMQALAESRDAWQDSSSEVVLALAGDEESMGSLGAGWLLDNVPAVGVSGRCDEEVEVETAMICGDAGSPLVVRVGEKGFVWLEISATGRAAHGAHVHRGRNAIEILMEAVGRVKRLLEEGLGVPPPEEVEEAISGAKEVSEPLSGEGEAETLRRVTVNVGRIEGGTSMNLVPAEARAELDIRLSVGVSTGNVEEIARYALEAARAVVGEKAVVNLRVGASDSRLYRQKGIPSVVVGLTPYNMGALDEYLMVEELCQVAQIHALAAYEFLK